jgi:hypothetical protein
MRIPILTAFLFATTLHVFGQSMPFEEYDPKSTLVVAEHYKNALRLMPSIDRTSFPD